MKAGACVEQFVIALSAIQSSLLYVIALDVSE